MYSRQRTGYVHRIEVVERVQLLLETSLNLSQHKNTHGKIKYYKQTMLPPTSRQLILCTLRLCSPSVRQVSISSQTKKENLHERKLNLQPFCSESPRHVETVKRCHIAFNFTSSSLMLNKSTKTKRK